MKHNLFALFAGAALLAAIPFSADAADKPAAKAPTAKQLMQEAQKVARTNDIAKTIAACDQVLALPDGDAYAVHMLLASLYQRQKPAQTDKAIAEYELAAAVKGATSAQIFNALKFKPEQDFRSNFPGSGFAAYTEDGIRKALDGYRKLLAMPVMANPEKIELHKRIANCLLELMQVEEANAELQKAIDLPGLTPAEKATAQINLANALKRELEPAKALAVFESVLKSGALVKNAKYDAEIIVMNLIDQVRGRDAAAAYVKTVTDNPWIADRYAKLIGDTATLVKMKEQQLNDPKAVIVHRRQALEFLLRNACESGDPAQFEAAYQKYAVPAVKTDPSFTRAVMCITGWTARGYRASVRKAVARRQMELEPQNTVGFKTFIELADYRAERADVLKAAEAALKIEKLSPADKLKFSVLTITLKTKDGAKAAKEIKALAAASGDEKLSSQKPQAELLKEAARTAMKCGEFDKAKTIWAIREGMLVQYDKRSITCKFIPNGPQDIAEFLASPYIKDPANVAVIDRKYGDNLQFLLETDAAITGRQVTKEGKEFKPSKFTVNCDENGVKIFFMMPCDPERAKNLKNGFGGFGGFETYLATGFDQPYFCYLIDMPPHSGMSDGFVTMYDNATFRRSREDNGNTHLSYKIGNDMLYCLLEIDWTAIRNGIPNDGGIWEFEPIHWEAGGWTWGGSRSVHNRSSFGNIVFANMTDANRTAIKRRLLVYAAGLYKKELNARVYSEIEHWKDPDLGDPAFYQAEVAPFVEKYGAYVQRIKADMTDAEVNEIYDAAYMPLVNTKFIIQQKRAEYLAEKQVSE